jgi:hypothetical protein
MIYIFAFLLALPASAEECNSILANSTFVSLVRQVQRLNNGLLAADAAPSSAQLYLTLKKEEQQYLHQNIPAGLAAELQTGQGKHYNLASLDLHALTRFYLNALHALIMRTADQWRREQVRRLVGAPVPGRLEEIMGRLLDSFEAAVDLDDPSTTVDQADRVFRSQLAVHFPWSEALQTLTKFGDRAFYEFAEWSKQNSLLDWQDANRIAVALADGDRKNPCCHSSDGCEMCPHNRKWLKP